MVADQDPYDHSSGSGKLCLDFANTVNWHASSHPKETLPTYAELIEWSKREGILSAGDAKALVASFEAHRELGSSVMTEAHALREAVYKLFSNAAHGKRIKQGDLQVLNANLSKGMSMARVDLNEGRFEWGWAREERAPDMMLWPIARSAADLLTSERLQQVKECANEAEGCGWLFLDMSRSGNRVWCSMDSCGNRSKSRSYYARHRDNNGKS